MTDSKKENFSFSNPFSGAFAGGLGGAVVTAIGASIQGHNVKPEVLAVLSGGAILGAIAGSVGCCIPDTANMPLSAQLLFGATKVGLSLMVTLAAPKMGNIVLGSDVDWSDTVVDGLIGAGVISASACGVALCCAGPAIYSLFKTSEKTPDLQSKENPIPLEVAAAV